MNKKNLVILIVFNSILLAELVFSLYQASKNPENVTVVFLSYFLILVIPTFIIGRVVVKRLLTLPKPTKGTLDLQLEEQKILYEKLFESERPIEGNLEKPKSVVHILKRRELIGKLSILFMILFIFSFLDGCVNKILHPPNLLDLMPGQSVNVNAPLEKKVKGIDELIYTTTSDKIKLTFNEIYTGFWLGGTEWRGVLTVDSDIKPGNYQVVVNTKEGQKFPFVFYIRIHDSKESLKRASMSLTKKISGLSPWLVFAFSGLLIAVIAFYILKLSNKIEAIMLQNGQAEVFFVKRGQLVTEILFGLGSKDNIKPGDILNIYTDKGKPIGNVIVQLCTDKNSVGIVKAEYNVKPGFIVAVIKPQ
ncbi:MAG: hypothetical protein ABDH16_06760 [Thermodesulfovibrionaceae bacterium]